jgi:hypothetical protein
MMTDVDIEICERLYGWLWIDGVLTPPELEPCGSAVKIKNPLHYTCRSVHFSTNRDAAHRAEEDCIRRVGLGNYLLALISSAAPALIESSEHSLFDRWLHWAEVCRAEPQQRAEAVLFALDMQCDQTGMFTG